jgi:chromosome segregation ATPase
MNWLREHMRDHLGDPVSSNFGENIVSFPNEPAPASHYETSSALDLVSEAAGVIRGIQSRAAESEARAKALAESALEKLQLAEARIQSAEAARSMAQEAVAKLSARLQEAEQELVRTRTRIVNAENALVNAERQMKAAEARAINAEKAVGQIENAIRTQLVGLQQNLVRRSTRAA